MDGREITVSISLALLSPDNPEHYVVPGGNITQRFVESGVWRGAIQNVTTSTHLVYPGTISRTIVSRDGVYKVFTHCVGINGAFCTTMNAPLDWVPQNVSRLVEDVFGAAAFRALDKQFKLHFDNNPISLPQGSSSGGGFQKPTVNQTLPIPMGGFVE